MNYWFWLANPHHFEQLTFLITPTIMTVAVTQILWRPRGLLVDQFDSKEDLINAVITSSFIPG